MTVPSPGDAPETSKDVPAPQRDAAASAADGFLLLDKPAGMTSFQALRPVKKLFKGRKVGHAGTLDPGASGLLLVGVGAGTRLLEHLEGMPKTYSFLARFGFVSDSYDMDGEVVPAGEAATRAAATLSAEEVLRALPSFRGEITQTPPVYSAVKVQGKRACDRVRDGETVALSARQVFVHSLELTGWEAGTGLAGAGAAAAAPVAAFQMTCSKGTYVRSLVNDLGRLLGCGAVTDKIRRLAIGAFRVEDARPIEALDPAGLLPLGAAVHHLPAARLLPEAVAPFLNGRILSPADYVADAAPAGAAVPTLRVLDPQGRLLALANLDADGSLRPKKVLAHQ